MRASKCLMRLVILALVIGGFGQAHATFFYASDGFTSDLVLIDSTNGSSSVLGSMGTGAGIGMAYNPNTATMYTRDFFSLYTVNISTAATTLVGLSGSGITALAFDGNFTTLYSIDLNTGQLYQVNPATGAATLIGNTGMNTPLDLSTNSVGVLYAATINANIYTIDTNTAAATLLFSAVDARGLTAIAFDESDNLYGVTLNSDMFVRINLTNGTTTTIGGPIVQQDIRGMDFVRNPIPEPATLSLLGLAALALLRRRGSRA